MQYMSANLKWQNDLGSFQGKTYNMTVIQIHAPTTDAKEADRFCEDLEDLLELTPKKISYSS